MHQNRFPSPYPTPLGAYGASTLAPSALVSAPRSSRLRRSAASQRLKPTLLLPSGAATHAVCRQRTSGVASKSGARDDVEQFRRIQQEQLAAAPARSPAARRTAAE